VAELSRVGGDAPFALLDFPNHSNIGDSAIWFGTTEYFLKHRRRRPSYVSTATAFSEEALRAAVPDGPIFIHGGGNFGDLWPRHQDFRHLLLEKFPDRQIVQLPQSIHFQDSSRVELTARAIDRHGRFLLLVRDQPSLEFATTHFDCEVRLCPDMALFLGAMPRERSPDVDALYLMRNDKERTYSVEPEPVGHSTRIVDWPKEERRSMRRHRLVGAVRGLLTGWPTRTNARRGHYDWVARVRTLRGCHLLSSGRAVITDRLHAHILCLLLGIPHAVLDNSYGKLGRFLAAWTGEAAGVHRASSSKDAEHWVASLLAGDKRFAHSP
jgi:exopolysaccharide biosynthesis predicted pyruvyltransferase EpsI